MKKTGTLASFLLATLGFQARATDIHWAQSASPILINSNLTIAETDRLIIDAGVEVRFKGYYSLKIQGSIIARGTSAKPIVFKSNDTTGLSDPNNTHGGWQGITSASANGNITQEDTLMYCNIQDLKLLAPGDGLTFAGTPFFESCSFYNNNSPVGINGASGILNLYHYGEGANQPVIRNCRFYNNYSNTNLIFGSVPGLRFEGNNLYNNESRYGLYILHSSGNGQVFLKNNDLRNNNFNQYGMGGAGAPFTLMNFKQVSIENNTIYNNKTFGTGAMMLYNCFGNVDHNLIANNEVETSTNVMCVDVSGGILHFSDVSDSSRTNDNKILLRNNILANNTCTSFGTITLYHQNCEITNNLLINNSTWFDGPSIYTWGAFRNYVVKNNIFRNNQISATMNPAKEFTMAEGNTLSFDYNYIDKPVARSMTTSTITIPDTSHNIHGNNPAVTLVPSDTGVSHSAIASDFRLLSNSPCIDAGTTMGITPAAADYSGNSRINKTIDIGPVEFGSSTLGIGATTADRSVLIWPNPAQNKINLIFPSSVSGTLQIFDLTGRLVLQKAIHKVSLTEIKVSGLPRANYILQWKAESGSTGIHKFSLQ